MRLAAVPEREVATSIVTYEEQMRGWLARIAQAHSPAGPLAAYSRLHEHAELFRSIPSVPFDEPSLRKCEELQRSGVRIRTMDLRIAAICLTNGATLLTRNLTHFARVPGLDAQDWTA